MCFLFSSHPGPGDIAKGGVNSGSGKGCTVTSGKPTVKPSPYTKCAPEKCEEIPTNIEEWQEQQVQMDEDLLDDRKRPEYRISYKQNVCTEDVFLQMGNKTTATASCDELVLDIALPEETVGIERMDLRVAEREIDLHTPVYRLKLPLVQPVNPDKGKALYDTDKRCLTLRLKMIREFDFVNF